MLVLTRKVGESIRIGKDITVQVLSVRSGEVSVGLSAPAEVRIFREEIFRAIESQNQEARLPDALSIEGAAEIWEEFAHGKKG